MCSLNLQSGCEYEFESLEVEHPRGAVGQCQTGERATVVGIDLKAKSLSLM